MKALMALLERRTLNVKLAISLALMLLLTIAVGIDGLVGQRAVIGDIRVLYEKGMQGIAHTKEAQIAYLTIAHSLRQATAVNDPAERERSLYQLALARSQLFTELDVIRPSLTLTLDDSKQNLDHFEEDLATYLNRVDSAISLLRNNRLAEADELAGSADFQKLGRDANELLSQLIRQKETGAKDRFDSAVEAAERSMVRSIGLIGGGSLLSIVLWSLLARSVHRPLNRLRRAVEQLAAGKLEYEVPHQDYGNEIGDLASAVAVLRNEARQMEAQRWIKSHIAEISQALQSADNFTGLSQIFLSSIAPLLKIGHGVFYIFEADQQRLRLLGNYAYRERKNLDQYFLLGQGLVGQCALERAPIILTQPPADYIQIGSSLGQAAPTVIAVLPVLRNDRLLAVVELATFERFGENQQALLDGLMPILAMSLEILERNVKTHTLLEETQRQANQLEAQAAELEEQQVSLRETSEHLAILEERSRLILGSVNDGIIGLDNEGRIMFVNPAVSATLGFAEAELIGKSMHTMLHHHHADGREYPQAGCPIHLTSLDGQARNADSEVFWRKSGRPVQVEYSTTPVYKDERLNGSVVVFRDITERKHMEEAIKHANFMSDSALELTKAGYWLIDYKQPDYYISSERTAAIFGEHPKPDWRYSLKDEWRTRIEAVDPKVAEANSACYVAALEGRLPRYDSIYCYRPPHRRRDRLDPGYRHHRARRQRETAVHVWRVAGHYRY